MARRRRRSRLKADPEEKSQKKARGRRIGQMGRMGCFVLVLILLIVGFDQWRIEQMRNELCAISTKVHVGHQVKNANKSGNSDLVTALAKAEQHTKNAKLLLKKKKNAQAQVELDKALKSLQSANTVSKDIVGDAAEFMGKARDNAVNVFQKAWKDISEEAKPKIK